MSIGSGPQATSLQSVRCHLTTRTIQNFWHIMGNVGWTWTLKSLRKIHSYFQKNQLSSKLLAHNYYINWHCQDLFPWSLFKTSGTSCFAVPPSPNSIPSLTNPLVSLWTVTFYFLTFFLSSYLFQSPLKFLKFSSLSLPFWITWQPPNLFLLPNPSWVTNKPLYFHPVALTGAALSPKSNKLKTYRAPNQPFQYNQAKSPKHIAITFSVSIDAAAPFLICPLSFSILNTPTPWHLLHKLNFFLFIQRSLKSRLWFFQ